MQHIETNRAPARASAVHSDAATVRYLQSAAACAIDSAQASLETFRRRGDVSALSLAVVAIRDALRMRQAAARVELCDWKAA